MKSCHSYNSCNQPQTWRCLRFTLQIVRVIYFYISTPIVLGKSSRTRSGDRGGQALELILPIQRPTKFYLYRVTFNLCLGKLSFIQLRKCLLSSACGDARISIRSGTVLEYINERITRVHWNVKMETWATSIYEIGVKIPVLPKPQFKLESTSTTRKCSSPPAFSISQ